jgi:chromosome segregation ATPase
MPPKKNTEKEASETGDMQMQDLFSLMKSMSVKLNNVESKMVTVEAFDSEVKTLRVLLEDLKSENIQIKKELKDKDKQLADMQDQLNRQEIRLNHVDQHHGVERSCDEHSPLR